MRRALAGGCLQLMGCTDGKNSDYLYQGIFSRTKLRSERESLRQRDWGGEKRARDYFDRFKPPKRCPEKGKKKKGCVVTRASHQDVKKSSPGGAAKNTKEKGLICSPEREKRCLKRGRRGKTEMPAKHTEI